jgi:7-cyano-7-deazaguanine synthase
MPLDAALVLYSGGQDSTACLAWALERYGRVETVGFDYDQRHAVELTARDRVREGIVDLKPDWAERLGPDHRIDIKGFGEVAESALTRERSIEMTDRGLPSTFVPARNLVFFTYAAALADRRGIDDLIGGMCETDYSGYPDCRRDTLDAMEQTLRLGVERPYNIVTPLMRLTKAETWALADAIGGQALVNLTIRETHTCYTGERGELHAWGYGCGVCPACDLRAKGFAEWSAQRSLAR